MDDGAYIPPRGPGGVHPDLNGIWQALGEAHYDIERHMARPSLQLREGPRGPLPSRGTLALGTVAAVPPGPGVVVDEGKGDGIPYTTEALAKRDENRAHWLERDPEIKCYLPGVPRATYMPFPFQIIQGENDIFFAYQYANAVRNIYSEDPGPAPIERLRGRYRQQILVRTAGRRRLIAAVERALGAVEGQIPRRAIQVDVDPYSLL